MLFSKNNALIVIGFVLVCVGVFGVVVGVAVLLDPVALELPGGDNAGRRTPSPAESLFLAGSYCAVIGFGIWLARLGFKRRRSASSS